MRRAAFVMVFVALVVALGATPSSAGTSEVWVCPSGDCGHPGQSYNSIQAGITAVDSGGTVHVAAGTYPVASTIVVNQPVTIRGPQAGVDPRPSMNTTRTPGGAGEAIVDGQNAVDTVLRIAADDVVLDGLEVKNGTGDVIFGSDSDPVKNRPKVRYCIVHHSGDEAIQIKEATAGVIEYNHLYDTTGDGANFALSNGCTIQYNEVHDIRSSDGAIYVYNDGSGPMNITIRGNLIYDVHNNDGIKVGDKGGSDAALAGGSVLGNIIHGARQDGIAVYASHVLVEGNEVYGCQSENGAIYLAYAITDITIRNNSIHDNTLDNTTKRTTTAGILLENRVDAANVTVTHNGIYGNTPYGVTNEAAALLHAEDNWWGDASGPYDPTGTTEVPPCNTDPALDLNANGLGNRVSDNVDYCGWLESSANLWVEPVEDAHLVGEEFAVEIKLNTMRPAYGIEVKLSYNPTVLDLLETTVEPGDLFTSVAPSYFFHTPQIDEGAGTVKVFPTRSNPAAQFVGQGVVARMRFRAKAPGDSALTLSQAILANIEGEQVLPLTTAGGLIHVLGQVTVSGQVELQGRPGRWQGAVITLTRKTFGDTYHYEVTVANADGTWSIPNVATGVYTVTAEMSRYLDAAKYDVPVSGPTNLAKVKLLGGDVNDNDHVFIDDLSAIGGQFGLSVPPGTNTDINDDLVVNILDLVLAAGNYDKYSIVNVPW
jgi:hypothetical protein